VCRLTSVGLSFVVCRSNHYGGLGGGHYTAYAVNDDGVWCHYDDSRITDHVDPKEVVSEAAYVVYYRRRDVVVNDNFLEGLESPTIVIDHDIVDKGLTPSETSSTNAAQGDDMDVEDLHTTGETGSNVSSGTCASPMDSHDDGDNHTDVYLDSGETETTYLHNSSSGDKPSEWQRQ
jgi:Ubiquitin carboxyl-terminal hydrolase